jgi:hypothetical protein
MIHYKYNSLEDFLNSFPLNIDGVANDGGGAQYPIKGIEFEATILFADISSFSARTFELSPIETLAFVNNFFSWISAEALVNSHGIIDKYIGDEIMVVFANEFGSENHFIEALQTARRMIENDALSFMPHIGLASGKIVVGYIGTPLKYNCSIFGNPVAVAARCATVSSDYPKSIIFPASNWQREYNFDEIISPTVIKDRIFGDTKTQNWEIQKSRMVEFKNMPNTEIIEITSNIRQLPSKSATERSKTTIDQLKKNGFYKQY